MAESLFEPIAIVGMAGRFPGAADVDELWRNVRAGVDSISRFTAEELAAAGVPADVAADPRYVPAKGVLDGVEQFDAEFFGFSPAEAEAMDPQQRLFLECAWQACEHAGYDPRSFAGRIGVYGGSAFNSYLLHHLLPRPERLASLGGLAGRLFNDKDFLTTHVSYKLNLRGPSVVVQTACSTSLVAVHLACQALLEGDCEMALAGGVAASFPHRTGYFFQEGGIASPDGRCRSFDVRAQGAVEGSGVGLVLLKRLADALADGDHVLAVVRGSAVNNDGAGKAGYTAPSIEGQTQVVRSALAIAQVAPESIGYLEAHGSATPLGDPIEVESLTRAFRSAGTASPAADGYCSLGSVKANLGHADNAAGIASLLKVVQALRHRQLPPLPHFSQPNPRLALASSPFYVATDLRDWRADGMPRRAGINSLGIGGTNAHLVLEEATGAPDAEAAPSRPWQLLTLSARSDAALRAMAGRLGEALAGSSDDASELPPPDFADAAYTLHVGRRAFRHRAALLCRTPDDEAAAADVRRRLERIAAAVPPTAPPAGEIFGQADEERPVVFLLPGLGDQFAGMGAELYRLEPRFRAAIDRAAALLTPHLGGDLREVLFPADLPARDAATPAAAGPDLRRMLGAVDAEEERRPIHRTIYAHPAVFAVEYALAELWAQWGIRPRAMIGYSLGEMVAACLAGVFSLADGLSLVAARARLIDDLPPGAMLAVPLPAADVEPLLAAVPDLALSAANGPGMSVVGGAPEAVSELARRLAERGIACRRLQTRHAFHTPAMQPIVAELTRLAAAIPLNAPRIPLISNVTGGFLSDAEAVDPTYWARHLCEPVRFDEGLTTLLGGAPHLLLEVGPGQTLGTLARQHPRRAAGQVVAASMRARGGEGSEQAAMLEALGRLWAAGASPDWSGFSAHERRRRVPLPTYPFERRPYIVERREPEATDSLAPRSDAAARLPLDAWFHTIVWERLPRRRAAPLTGRWLILGAAEGVGERLAARLESRGAAILRADAGGLAELRRNGTFPDHIVHLQSLSPAPPAAGFQSLLALARDLAASNGGAVHVAVVTDGLFDVVGDEELWPEKATLLGPCRVMPQEIPGVTCTVLDLASSLAREELIESLVDEPGMAIAEPSESIVALRGAHRWGRRWRQVPLPAKEPAGTLPARLRQGGVYLIAGGLTESGVRLAELLFRVAGAHLALLAAVDDPPRARWESWLSAHDDGDERGRRLRRILALENRGCQLLVLPVDLTRATAPAVAAAAVEQVRRRFGALHGVIQAATDTGVGLLQWTTPAQADAALAPAVRGTLALAAAADPGNLDLFALCGSSAALTGGIGQTAAVAASAFLDAYAQSAARSQPSLPVVQAIDWGLLRWQPVTAPNAQASATLHAGLERYGIGGDDYDAVWLRLLDGPLAQAAVITQHPAALQAQVDGLASSLLAPSTAPPARDEAAAGTPAAGGHPRPELPVPYAAPATAAERGIAAVWQEIFALDRVGIHDNFFDLAGNSLLAIQIVTRIAQTLGVELPMVSLLESPTIAELAARAEPLLAAPGTAVAPAAVEEIAEPALQRPVIRHEERETYPLSFDQERLWFNQQLDLDSPIYNIYGANRYEGPLHPPLLTRALNDVVSRHDILRTTFPEIDGRPIQRVAPHLTVTMPLVDLRALPATRREAEVQALAAAEVRAPFALDRLPLFRALVLQVGDEEFVVPICIHHIVTDWISYYAFEGELTAVYAAFRDGHPPPIPRAPLQFGDFALWQRERLGDPAALADLLAYWRVQLADAPDLLPLPADRPRPAVQTPWGARRSLVLSHAHSDGLRAIAQAEGLTLFIAGLAMFKALLVRLSGQEKLIVGTPIAYRNSPELQDVLGFFINQLALYTDLTGNPPARQLLRRVRDVSLAAYAHQELPFAKLIDALRPQRDLSRVPFTQIVFLFLNPSQLARPDLPELRLTPYWVDAQRTQFDMTFSLWDHDAVIEGWMEYNTDLFDGVTIDRMKEQYRVLLAGVLADPECPLWDLPLLPAGQRQQLLLEWPAGDRPPVPAAAAGSVVERIAAQAARTPDAAAVVMAGTAAGLTYAELMRRAGELAARLRRLGAGPEVPVGVCGARSTDLLVGLVAVLQAGSAFLPLDPAYPDARLALLMADGLAGRLDAALAPDASSAPALVLADRGLRERLVGLAGARPLRVLALDDATDGAEEDEEIAANDAGKSVAIPPRPGDPAYLIYTSGTTGTPKAVVVEHGSLGSVLAVAQADLGVGPGDRVASLAPFSFDISLFELLMPLTAGAAVVLFDLAPALDLECLVAELPRLAVLHAVPALMRQLVEMAALRPPGGEPHAARERGGPRHVCCGGDRVTPDVVAAMRRAFPRAALHLLYGPTEATIYCCEENVSAPGYVWPAIGSPLGRQIAAAEILLFNHDVPAPIGVTGEIFVGGAGVARGYLRRPELTAERFPVVAGRRLYRSGDLARRRPDGSLEFLGRADGQVKVRGFRIEVGEIEAALAALPAVREAVVEARAAAGAGADGALGNNRLVAYVVPAPELGAEASEVRPDALRRALQQTLPEHMLPTAWVVLPALPLTPHGKVDRRALPDPEPAGGNAAGGAGDAGPGGAGGQPQTRVEEQLAAIWAEVLGRGEVGRDDNFFALGGDSILSIQVVVRAQRLGIAISPKLLFQHQTLAALAAVAGSAPRIAAEQGAVVGPLPLTPVQRLFFAGDPPAPHHDNQALLLELDRRLTPRALRAALAALTAHHDALRLRFRRGVAGGWEQHSMPPGEEAPPCAVIDLSALVGKSAAGAVTGAIEAAAAGVQASLDLEAGPVQRLVYFDLGARQSGRLLWVLNHLVVDGVSWRILLADLAALYEQAERGTRSPLLPPKTTSFKAWAEKLGAWAATPDLTAELDYWRGLPWAAVQPLPGGAAGAGEASGVADAGLVRDERTAVMTLSPEDTQALLHEVPRPYGTQIQEALLSALARAVRAWSGAEVVLVDVEGHGREEIFPDVDLTRTVGWFTSVVPAVLDLRAVRGGERGDAGEAGEALKAAKEQLRRLPHGGIGYGVLRYLSGAADELAALPSAGMSFNYLGQLDQALPADSPFRPAGESAGAARSPLARRHHPLAWSGGVVDGRLQLVCAYDARHFGAATIGQLTEGLEASLRQLIAHCRQPETGGYTPSDFPLTGLDQAKLNRILAARKGARP